MHEYGLASCRTVCREFGFNYKCYWSSNLGLLKRKKNVEKETQEHLFWFSNISGASEIPTIIISNFVISKAEYHYT